MTIRFLLSCSLLSLSIISTPAFARCDYPNDLDSAGRRCGGRAASVIPGGRLGGDGKYNDSQGRQRVYGKDNDPYDSPSTSKPYGNSQNNSQTPNNSQKWR